MKGKTHVLINVFLFLFIYGFLIYKNIVIFSWKIFLIDLGILVIYSMLPDLDSKTSIIKRIFTMIIFLSICACMVLSSMQDNPLYGTIAIGLVALFLIVSMLHHRGIMHNFFFGLVVSLPFLFYSKETCIVALLAYTMHLIEDKISS